MGILVKCWDLCTGSFSVEKMEFCLHKRLPCRQKLGSLYSTPATPTLINSRILDNFLQVVGNMDVHKKMVVDV